MALVFFLAAPAPATPTACLLPARLRLWWPRPPLPPSAGLPFLPGQQGEACDDPRDRGLVDVEGTGPCFLDEVLSHIASRDDECFPENAIRFLYSSGFQTIIDLVELHFVQVWDLSPFYIGRRDLLDI